MKKGVAAPVTGEEVAGVHAEDVLTQSNAMREEVGYYVDVAIAKMPQCREPGAP